MNPMKQSVLAPALGLLVVIQLGTGLRAAATADTRSAMVQVFTERFVPHYAYPWQLGSIEQGSGSGVVIAGNKILTAAHVVDDGLAIHVQKAGSDRRYKGVLDHISDASDLALVIVDDAEFWEGTTHVDVGTPPALGDEVVAWGFPTGGSQLALTKGVVSRIDFDEYAHSGVKNLVYQIDAAINSGASGGALTVGGLLAGIAFQNLTGDDVENIGYVIPVPVIRQFLDDVADGTVDGVPTIAIKTQTMRNAQLRDAYRMRANRTGVLVVESRAEPHGVRDVIKAGDILLEIEGLAIGDDGTAPFASGDRIDLNFFFTRHQLGDTIPIVLLRACEEMTITYTFKYTSQQVLLVTRHYSGFVPDFEVVGGLVLQKLSLDYLAASFEEDEIPEWVVDVYDDYKQTSWDQEQKVVFLSGVLPDEINIGYEEFEDGRVISVNGRHIDNLDQLRQAVRDNESPYHVLKFDHPAGEVVLNRQQTRDRAAAIRERYRLPE